MGDKKNDFFSFFNGTSKKKETKKIIFDENYFNLNVIGGKLHSEKIIIEAIAIVDNEKLGTEIKWFQISPNGDFNPLAISGNQYQPSIEDVGSKFMIQVVPIKEGRQYEGMPKSQEIGPLKLDESIQEEIDELLENEKMTVFVTLEQFLKKDFNIEAELPISCILRVTLKNMELDLKKNDQTIHQLTIPLDATFPSCQSKQGTDQSFILRVDANNEFLIKAADNTSRDIILTVIKGLYGKSIWKNQENFQEEEDDEEESESEAEENDRLEDQQTQEQVEITQNEQIEVAKENSSLKIEQQIVQVQNDVQEEQVEIKSSQQSPLKEEIVQNEVVEQQNLSPIKEETQNPPPQEIHQEEVIENEENKIPQQLLESTIEESALNQEVQQQAVKENDEPIQEIKHSEEKVQVEEQQKPVEKVEEPQQNIISVRSCSEEIIPQQEIKQEVPKENVIQIETENDDHAQQKQRSDHKFQSVIVTSEIVKEEKQSPTKKKEKKTNVELYMQINENVKLKQDLEQARIAQAKDQEQIQKQLKQLQKLNEQLANCTRNYYQVEEECANQKKIMHSLNDQKIFLQQDINMYKTQLLELTEVNQNQKDEIQQLQKRLKRQAQSQDLNEAKKLIDQLKEDIAKKDLMLEAANQDHIQAQKKIEDLEKEIEGYQNQLQHEKKKYDSLAIEKGIKQPSVIEKIEKPKLQFEKNIRDIRPVAQSMIQLDDADRYSIDISQSLSNLDSDAEVNRLKTQIMHLEATLRSLKIAYEQDVRYTKGKPGKGPVGSSKDIKYLQHIANNMAEIITEKDMQLENQMRINRELLTKLQVLQQQ